MKTNALRWLYLFTFLTSCGFASAQQPDPEFEKGYVLWGRLNNGAVTAFNAGPDLYVGGLQLNPQFTVAEHVLRAGVNAGVFYDAKKISFLAGPNVALKLTTFKLPFEGASLGSAGNLQLTGQYNWGSNHQRLVGLGLAAELGTLLLIGIDAQRDYNLNAWWLQGNIAIRLNKLKKATTPNDIPPQ